MFPKCFLYFLKRQFPSRIIYFVIISSLPILNSPPVGFKKYHRFSNSTLEDFDSVSDVKLKVFPGGSVVKNLPAMQETQIRYLGQEDPLEEGTATHSNILAWRIPWTEEPVGAVHRTEKSQTQL